MPKSLFIGLIHESGYRNGRTIQLKFRKKGASHDLNYNARLKTEMSHWNQTEAITPCCRLIFVSHLCFQISILQA